MPFPVSRGIWCMNHCPTAIQVVAAALNFPLLFLPDHPVSLFLSLGVSYLVDHRVL